MKKVFLVVVLMGYLFGCADLKVSAKSWHISPPRDPRWSEIFVSIPYTNACMIKKAMTRKQVEKLANGYITTTIMMPNYPFFITKNKAGDLIEVAVKMTKDDKVEDISFKKIWTAKQLSALKKLNKLKVVDGAKVYYAGEKGEFYKLYEFFIKHSNKNDFLYMLHSQKPIVRIMGALCLVQKYKTKYKNKITALYKDNELVDFFPAGCVGGSMKTGEIIKLIVQNPNLLD